MFKKSKPIVAIEINSSFIRIIEAIRIGRELRIINYVQIPSSFEDLESIFDKLSQALKEKHIMAQDVYLAIYSSQIEHHFLQVPPLSKKEMQQAIREEVVAENSEKIQEIYYDYCSSKEVESAGVKKREVLLTSAPRQLINKYIEILQKSHLNPCQIVGASLAIPSAITLTNSSQEDTALVFLYLLAERGYITLINHGAWRFTREILLMSHYQKAGSESIAETPVEAMSQDMGLSLETVDIKQIALEINRAILYFTEVQQETQVKQLIISSDRLVSQDLIDLLAEKLDLTVEVFDPCPKLNLTRLGDGAHEFQQVASSMVVPIGLLRHGGPEMALNLLPREVRERKKRLASSLLIILVVTGYSLSLIGAYWGLRWARDNLKQSLNVQQQSLQVAQPRNEEVQKTQRERQEHELVLSVLKSFEHPAPLWRGVFYELSYLLPPSLSLSSFTAAEKQEQWHWQTKGRIEAGDSLEGQVILNRFITNLEHSAFFAEPKIHNLSIGPGAELGSNLNFELSCLIRH